MDARVKNKRSRTRKRGDFTRIESEEQNSAAYASKWERTRMISPCMWTPWTVEGANSKGGQKTGPREVQAASRVEFSWEIQRQCKLGRFHTVWGLSMCDTL